MDRGSRPDPQRAVFVQEVDGRYTLVKNGEPFFVKGAGGDTHFKALREAGGNTLRVWDTTNLAMVLDSAHANGLSVIAGIPIPNSNYAQLYDNPTRVAQQLRAITTLVDRLRSHPALLMWCLGNELIFPSRFSNTNFYSAFNDLTDIIHEVDPDHPVTTTLVNLNVPHLLQLITYCDLDIISFNIYGSIVELTSKLADIEWFWNGPFLVTEWGINGPWEGTSQTTWGAYLEDNSTHKARVIEERYQRYMPHNDPGFLGSCIFYWGYKQETSHTWFSLFDKNGHQTEAVGVLQHLWTGQPTSRKYPEINEIRLNGGLAGDNILLVPETRAKVTITITSHGTDAKKVNWQVFPEDWYKENEHLTSKALPLLYEVTTTGDQHEIEFVVPKKDGPYRLFANVYDAQGNFGTSNIPFYVIRPQ